MAELEEVMDVRKLAAKFVAVVQGRRGSDD
jgi:hypothetical protein